MRVTLQCEPEAIRHRLLRSLHLKGMTMGSHQVVLIRDGQVIDGTGRKPLLNASILVEDGRFKEITRERIEAPAGAMIVEATDKTILPGLTDMHGHLLSGGFDTITKDIDSFDLPSQKRALKQMLYWGVTAVYSPVQPLEAGLKLRAYVAEHGLLAPRIFISGPGFTSPGGWAGSLLPLARIEPKDVTEVTQHINLLAHAPVDFVKIYYDTQCCAFLTPLPKLAKPLMERITLEAHSKKLKVMVHSYDIQNHKDALRAGADIMAHSAVTAPIDDEYLELAKENQTLYLATLSAYHDAFNERTLRDFIAQDFVQKTVPMKTLSTLAKGGPLDDFVKNLLKQDYLKAQLPTIQANLKKVFESGVAVGVGPDTGVMGAFPGISVHREMELMVQAGLPPADVLVAATKTAAEYLGQNSLGTIQEGKSADLIMVNGNPLADIKHTRNIELVMKEGWVLDREKLLEEILAE
jgi:imidazolonepropionase-like amidohydrolase